MRKPEQELWHYQVKPALESQRGKVVWTRHEDRVSPGTPDLSFAASGSGGWVELKRLKAPRKRTSKLAIRHLTQQQVGFLELRGHMGQSAFVLVQVDEVSGPASFYLFGHWVAGQLAEGLRYDDWEQQAVAHWSGRIDGETLVEWLAGHQRGVRVG